MAVGLAAARRGLSTPFPALAPFIARHAPSVARASSSALRTALSPVAFAALSIDRTAPLMWRSAGSFLTLARAARALTCSILASGGPRSVARGCGGCGWVSWALAGLVGGESVFCQRAFVADAGWQRL